MTGLHPLEHAPCGECGHLVPRTTGCVHWRPVKALARAIKARSERETVSRRKRAVTSKASAAEFQQMMGVRP